MSYKLLYNSSSILRVSDGVSFSADAENRDYQEYQMWVNSGNIPLPADQPTPEQLAKEVEIKQAPLLARQWLLDNPAISQIFTLSISELESEIATHVAALFPLATAQVRARETKIRMAQLVVIRMLVKREL